MAAPLFTKDEIDSLLAAPKWVEDRAWQEKLHLNREGKPGVIPAKSENFSDATFAIEFDRDQTTCSLILSVEMGDGRPMQAICRYDIQDAPHSNWKGAKPKMIKPRQPHRHVYTERGMREFGKWDKFAELIEVEKDSFERLLSRFVIDLNIRFRDKGTASSMFEFMR